MLHSATEDLGGWDNILVILEHQIEKRLEDYFLRKYPNIDYIAHIASL